MPNIVSTNVHNLGESRAEALQVLGRVSDRLGEILGDVAEDGTHRNDNGELVNEEGLPIIDITEPIDDLDTPSLSAATQEDEVVEDNFPEPISNMSPEALAIGRKHRDKILDLLEEEEAREARRTRKEQLAELQQKREAARNEMEKRMMAQSGELEKRRQTKELEKKMAKALISGPEKPERPINASVGATPLHKKKKNVSFADTPSISPLSQSQPEQHPEVVAWGDVVPGRLSEKQTLVSRLRSQPMKTEVIERLPALEHSPSDTTPPPNPPKLDNSTGDSDDESEADEHSDSDSILTFESGEDVVSSAHLHRELALEYHNRREALASSAGSVRLEHIDLDMTSAKSNDWDKEDVPLEATLVHPPPKSPISKFKAALANKPERKGHLRESPGGSSSSSRLDASFTFGTPVLPPDALAQSVKMGKLVDGKLVAGFGEGEEEQEAREEEEIRKLLVKSMEGYSSIAAQVMGSSGPYWMQPETHNTVSSTIPQPQTKSKPEASRFKVNRNQSRSRSDASKHQGGGPVR